MTNSNNRLCVPAYYRLCFRNVDFITVCMHSVSKLGSCTARRQTNSYLTQMHARGFLRKLFSHNTLTRLLAPYLT